MTVGRPPPATHFYSQFSPPGRYINPTSSPPTGNMAKYEFKAKKWKFENSSEEEEMFLTNNLRATCIVWCATRNWSDKRFRRQFSHECIADLIIPNMQVNISSAASAHIEEMQSGSSSCSPPQVPSMHAIHCYYRPIAGRNERGH